jgi:hypothetical protein
LNFKDPLIKEKLSSFTNMIASVGPQFQEIMVVTNAKKDEARNKNGSLEKQMEKMTQKK